MASVTQTEVTHLIETIHAPMASRPLYREDVLFDLPEFGEPEATPGMRKLNGVIPYVPTEGGYQLDWPVEYASEDAEEMTNETDVLPDPNTNSFTNATQSPRYFWDTLKIYRQTLDGARGDAQVIDILADKMRDRYKSLRNKINTTLLGTGSGNLQAIIDETTSYAGISSRSTYLWDSKETAVGGAIALSDFEDLIEALVLRGGQLQDYVWLMRPNQVTNIMSLAGWAGNAVVQKVTEVGGAFDPSFIRSRVTVGGIPVVESTSVTSTVIMLLHMPSFEWRVHKPFPCYVMQRLICRSSSRRRARRTTATSGCS